MRSQSGLALQSRVSVGYFRRSATRRIRMWSSRSQEGSGSGIRFPAMSLRPVGANPVQKR